jgi:uncharacterized membrane protein
MAILGVLTALAGGIFLGLCDYAASRPIAGQEEQLSPAELKQFRDLLQKASQAAAVAKPAAPPVVEPPPSPPQPPIVTPATPTAGAPVTQNVVTTSGPVSSETSISIGTLAGQVLTWATLAFGSLMSSFLTAYIIRLLKNAGIQGTELLSDKLDRIILNGLNSGAALATADMAGKGQIQIKNEVAARAVAYAQAHGADTIKKLGLDPQSGAAVEAIKARIETAIADPAQPTPAVLDPTKSAPGLNPGGAIGG